MASVWVVVPAYNEAPRLGATLEALCRAGRNVVVVDDGSSDGTAEVALRHDAWVLRHPLNRGQGAALRTGLHFALARGADVIVTFDADGQHDPAELDALVAPVLEGRADVALGSRFLGAAVGIPRSRRLLLRAAVLFTRIVSRVSVTDAHNGFRAFARHAAARLRLAQDRMAHASEILDEIHAHRLRYVEVPVTIRYSGETLAKGQSGWAAMQIASDHFLGRLFK